MSNEEKFNIAELNKQLATDFEAFMKIVVCDDVDGEFLHEAFNFLISEKHYTYEHRKKRLYQHHYIAMGILCAYNEIL